MSVKKIWSWLTPLLVLVGLVGGFFTLVHFQKHSLIELNKEGIETIGIVYDESKRIIKVRYMVDGKSLIHFTGKGYPNIIDGEEFLMKYSPEDPELIIVYFDRPYLSQSYEWAETNCTSMSKTLSVIDFWYILDGKEYRRKTLDRDHSLNPSNYSVKYRVNDPRVGYLFSKEKTE
jgi:hypothetical protein